MSSQLDFITNKSVWDILDNMLAQTPDIVDKREGSVLYDAVLSVAVELEELYAVRIPQLYQAFQIIAATGDDLDNWALDFGLTRLSDEYTYYNIQIDPQGQDLAVDEVLRSHDTNVLWVYQGDNVVRSQETGNFSETRGSALEPENAYQETTSITFNGLRSAGRDVESDAELRMRIISSLSTRVGGSVMDYAYIIINQYLNAQNERIPCTLVFSIGRDNGHVRVFPASASFSDIGQEHDLSTMERWCTQEQCDALKEYLDPQDAEGHGYGLAPIGHMVHVMRGGYYDMQFKIYVVFRTSDGLTPAGEEDGVPVYDVPSEIAQSVEEATLAYNDEIIDRGMFTRTNSTPERRGGRYRMLYMSSEHVARLEAIKGNWPEVMGFQISYKKPGDEEWVEASDDYVQLVNSWSECRMFRVSALLTVGKIRAADWGEVNW